MTFWIGLDEAGYGPNLGPLLIGASVWRTPGAALEDDLYERLAAAISPVATSDGRLVCCDSKVLHTTGDLRPLELSLATLLCAADLQAAKTLAAAPLESWRGVWQRLTIGALEAMAECPCYRDFDAAWPTAWPIATIADRARELAAQLERCEVTLFALAAQAIFPREFNRTLAAMTDQASKGACLTTWTLGLLRSLVDRIDPVAAPHEPIVILGDKHGGRNFYAGFLQQIFSEGLVQVRRETRPVSSYEIALPTRRLYISFQSQGERQLATAAASITAKYLRELAMLAFNHFWQGHLPALKATAGYPLDAKRFMNDIEARREALALDKAGLWRNR